MVRPKESESTFAAPVLRRSRSAGILPGVGRASHGKTPRSAGPATTVAAPSRDLGESATTAQAKLGEADGRPVCGEQRPAPSVPRL